VDLVPAVAERRVLVRRSAQLAGAAARTPAFAERTAADRNPHPFAAGLPVASVPVESCHPRRTDRSQRERASSLRNPADSPPACAIVFAGRPSRGDYSATGTTPNGIIKAIRTRLAMVETRRAYGARCKAIVPHHEALSENLLGLSFFVEAQAFQYANGKLEQ
jgi:hypothetical protein